MRRCEVDVWRTRCARIVGKSVSQGANATILLDDMTPKSLALLIPFIWGALSLGARTRSQSEPQRASCGATSDGIALCLAASTAPDSLVLEIRNEGSSDAVLELGVALANGAYQYPTAIRLTLTDSHGATHGAELAQPAVVAGRLDPLIVPLPAGAARRLPLAFSKYAIRDRAGKLERFGLVSGEQYTVRAELKGLAVSASEVNLDMKGLSVVRYWTGMAASNPVTAKGP